MYQRILSIVLAICLVGCAPKVEEKEPTVEAIRVLFVGNSHTSRNNVPLLVKRINDAQTGSPAIEASAVMWGGFKLSDHVQNGGAVQAISRKHWDFVVMQPASTEAFVNPDGQVASFRQLVESVGPKTTPILYGVWHREAGDKLHQSFGTTPAGAARAIRETNLATIRGTRSRLAPVGDAWVTAELKHREIPLYTDGNHATLEGSYMAAAVILRAILQKPLTTEKVWRPWNLTEDNAKTLLEVANTVTLVSPEENLAPR